MKETSLHIHRCVLCEYAASARSEKEAKATLQEHYRICHDGLSARVQ